MEKVAYVRLYYLPDLDTLDLWLDEPTLEVAAEPRGDNVVLKLAEGGRVIGVEVLSLSKLTREDVDALPAGLRETLVSALRRLADKAREMR